MTVKYMNFWWNFDSFAVIYLGRLLGGFWGRWLLIWSRNLKI